MELFNTKTAVIIIFLLGLLLPIGLFYTIIGIPDRNTSNFLSLIGAYISLFGLSVAYFQIFSVKEMTLATKKAVDENAQKISQILSVSDLSKASGLTEQIQQYMIKGNYQPALLRMKDLKAILVQSAHIKELENFTKTDEYSNIISNLTLDLNNLTEYLVPDNVENRKKKISFSVINSNLENISTVLVDFVTKLKVGNDT